MTYRAHSCGRRRDSSPRLPVNLRQTRTGVEMSLDAARTSACGTMTHKLLYGLFGISLVLGGQAPTATFQTSTQLVIQTVSVKDKNGKAIENLAAKDFTVTEDGVPQAIKFFEFQKLQEIADTPPMASSIGAV